MPPPRMTKTSRMGGKRGARQKTKKAISKKSRSQTLSAARNTSALKEFVKQTVDSRREYKWFKTIEDSVLANKSPRVSTDPGRGAADPTASVAVCCMGYSTTVVVEPGKTEQVYYPGARDSNGDLARTNPMRAMTMCDTFAPDEAQSNGATRSWFRAQTPDGVKVTPVFARSKFIIERLPAHFNTALTYESGQNDQPGLGTAAIKLLPIRCRVIRVYEKTAPGVALVNVPAKDLFLSQYGQEYGVDFSVFGENDAQLSQINRRRYTVLDDYQFTLEQSTVINHDGGYYSSGHNAFTSRPVGCPGNALGSKEIQFDHQLTVKKGGDLIFNAPDATGTNNPSAGGRREYVFLHFWYMNSTPALRTAAGHASPADEIMVSCTPSSAFRD